MNQVKLTVLREMRARANTCVPAHYMCIEAFNRLLTDWLAACRNSKFDPEADGARFLAPEPHVPYGPPPTFAPSVSPLSAETDPEANAVSHH
jgi:hypothetical protein